MSNQWNNSHFQQGLPSAGNQIRMFNPTQFHTPTTCVATPTSKPRLHTRQQSAAAPTTQNTPSLQATQSSWSSWDSWNWNSESANASAADQQQQTEQAQQPAAFEHQQMQQGGTGDNQYYGDGRYSSTWNQGWDAANQYSQPQQIYSQPDPVALYQSQQLQQEQPQWGHEQYDGHTYGQVQQDASMLGQIPYNTSDSNTQHQQQSQQNQQSFSDQFYYQQQTTDQGQVYNQSHEQYQVQPDASQYNNPYNAGTWMAPSESGQWVSGNYEQPQLSYNPEAAKQEGTNEQQLNVMQNALTESTTQPFIQSESSHDNALARPGLEVYHADDDGTVSGFFGRDDDGDVVLDSQRHIQGYGEGGSGNQASEISTGLNPYLSVGQPFLRTDSEISNASLSTVNLSNSEDDEGRKRLQKMGEVALAQREWKENNINIVNPLVGNTPRAGPYYNQDVSNEFLQKQTKEGHVGYTSNAYNSPDLPLNTNIRPSSPDGEQPDSAESGGSGGSSGLADWEIVPPQTSSLTLSHNSHLDNGISLIPEKLDEDVRATSSYGSLEHQSETPQDSQSQASFSATSDQNVHSGVQNMGVLEHSSFRETQTTCSHESVQSHQHTSGHSSNFPAAAFRDHQQRDSLPYTSLPPLQLTAAAPPTASSNLPIPSLPQTDVAANPFRRDGGKSPRHASSSHSVSSVNPSLISQGDAWSAENKAYLNIHPSSDTEKARALTTITSSKPKEPISSSVEDGNRISRRDSDHSITSADASQTKRSIPNPGQVTGSDLQQQHHSAFQPVGRPQQATMSPAAALWDNSQTPSSNILLAPVVPLIIPALNPYSTSAAITTSNAVEASTVGTASGNKHIGDNLVSKGQYSSVESSTPRKVNERKEMQDRSRRQQTWKEEKNRSFDSLDEIGTVDEAQRRYNNGKSEVRKPDYESNYDRRESDKHNSDQPLSRNNHPSGRYDSRSHYHSDQTDSRTEGYSKEDSYRKQRDYYRDYGERSYDERYDRPRSRQDESHSSRPSSRSTQEVTRPRSRADYDRDRDYYYRVRQRGYDYDSYSRNTDYHLNEEREGYSRYSKEKEARYARAYYEEYYGTKYAEYYRQLQQHHQLHYQDRRVSNQEFDTSSSHSQSRGSTPAVGPSPGPDYYGSRDSRPTSRTDYNRDYYNRGHSYEGYSAYYDGYSYDPHAYGYPGYDEYSQAHDQGRMTPPKYSYPHARGCFGPGGQLVKVLPNRPKDGQPAIVEIQDIQTILENCPEAEELRLFPGPLIRKITHKKDVLLFCQQKARGCAEDINMIDRESAQLIWRFLELLIKQNGSVVGTDLADLLLEGHEPSTHEYSLHGMKISQSSETLDTVPEVNSEDSSSARASPAVRVTSDRTVISSADTEREKWVDRFRHLLLYGRKKDALECAMKNNLWGHALFLASKMDARTYANVMTRFANSAMRMNDPLQTLYQLMSGRQPAAVTCVVDERWGDWRPHLAMILSNQATRHDIDRKSITTLGDTLAAKGYLYASHFCYLMTQVNFGNYFKKTSKIVLIGTSHNLPMEEFAINEAIQCTEVYEYAKTLAKPEFCLPHLQIYKYLYACRLADYGMIPEALHYCEVIACNIQQNPAWFQAPFARLVCQLSRKLQYSDPQYQVSEEEKDHLWIQQLESVCQEYDNGSIQSLSDAVTSAGFPGTTTSSESAEYSQAGYRYGGDAAAANVLTSAHGVDAYGHQTFPEDVGGQDVNAITGQIQNLNITDQHHLQQGYSQQQLQGYGQEQQGYSQQQLQGYGQEQQGYSQQQLQGYGQQQGYSQQQYDYSQWQQQQQYGCTYSTYEEQEQQQHPPDGEQIIDQSQRHHQSSLHHHDPLTATDGNTGDNSCSDIAESYNYTDDISSFGGSHLDSSSSSTQLASQLHPQGYGGYEAEHHQQPRGSISTTEDDDDDGADYDDDEDVLDAPASGFDYFGSVGSQKVVAPPHRYRSMSGSSAGSTRRRRTISDSSTGSVKAAPHKPAPQQQPAGGKGGDRAQKDGQQDKSGWFGGLFNKFKQKGKNEMILPDDKNPPIVWDPAKKKWTNADGTEEVDAPKVPPPKDTDLLGKSSAASTTSMGPPPSSNVAEGNRFSLKAKGARNQYVDVNNPVPVSLPQNLFNATPGAPLSTDASPQAFLPGSGRVTNTDARIVSSSTGVSLATGPESGNSLDASNITTPSIGATQHPPHIPVLFNPATMRGSSSTGVGQMPSAAAGPGLKYGQRRAYPK